MRLVLYLSLLLSTHSPTTPLLLTRAYEGSNTREVKEGGRGEVTRTKGNRKKLRIQKSGQSRISWTNITILRRYNNV